MDPLKDTKWKVVVDSYLFLIQKSLKRLALLCTSLIESVPKSFFTLIEGWVSNTISFFQTERFSSSNLQLQINFKPFEKPVRTELLFEICLSIGLTSCAPGSEERADEG